MKKKRKPILIYLATLVVLGLLIYAVPKVTDIFETTEILEPGYVQVSEEVTCYFVRNETVYVAGAPGKVDFKVKEGTHIRTGTVIADFEESQTSGSEIVEPRSKYDDIIENVGKTAVKTVSYEAQSSGVLSYYADGYEKYLLPEDVEMLTWKDVKDVDNKGVELTEKNVRTAEPVFKICDNDNWYILCWVESASVGRYQPGDDIRIQFDDGTVDMTVQSITQDGDKWKLVLWSNNYYERFAQARVEEGLLDSKDYAGLIVKNSSITTKDNQLGVWVLQKNGDFAFTPVQVIASDGEYSALKEISFIDEKGNLVYTVNVYDEVLKKPSKASD